MFVLQVTHHFQYPPGTETVYSYFESRDEKFLEVTFFELQYIIKVYNYVHIPLRSIVCTHNICLEAILNNYAVYSGMESSIM